MPLDHLWATWRSVYLDRIGETRGVGEGEGTLFERLLAAGDAEGDDSVHIVRRGPTCFVVLNRFPYTVGHLMVVPNRAVAELHELRPDEERELWSTVRDAVPALRAAFGCDGVNVGLNLGSAAGGSQSDHLHVHCVPRWVGDANFIGVTAEARVLPMSLEEAVARLRDAWGSPPA